MAQRNHIAIQERTNHPAELSLKNKLETARFHHLTTDRQITTIFRVPSHIRERHKNFYEPQIVSIGPYHRGSKRLRCMEQEKLRYLQKTLDENPAVTLNDYLVMLGDLEPEARSCYYEKIPMESSEFLEMLLCDACFIIQLAVNWSFSDNDILYEIGWNIPFIKSDLLMLENQIPFFVLQNVFNLYTTRDDNSNLANSDGETPNLAFLSGDDSISEDNEDRQYLYDILVKFIEHGSTETLMLPKRDQNYEHLLHFYYQCYMHIQEFQKFHRKTFSSTVSNRRPMMRLRHKVINQKPRTIPSATELQEAGITFKKAKSKSIFDVDFSNGVLRIPNTPIEEATMPQTMNLIAFEQCRCQNHKPLTSYAVFMDCLVNTSRDVLLLQQNKIIENKLTNEKAAAEFFNHLSYCFDLDYEHHHLAEVFKKVSQYCDSRWQRYRVRLHHGYRSTDLFKNPWTVISFVAATVLLILTFLQTLCSIMSYHHSSSH